jgi:membrane protein YqaA with SNARE-associated domain
VKKNKLEIENRNLYLLLFVVSALILILPFFLEIDIRGLRSLGIFGVALINFISSSTLFFPTPGILATGIGGVLYNPILVALAAAVGSSLGESIGFLFGHSSRKISYPVKHGILDALYKAIHHRHGAIIIVILAFIPNPFFDAVGIIAGLAFFPLKKFLLLVFIGRFARSLIVAYIGSNIA